MFLVFERFQNDLFEIGTARKRLGADHGKFAGNAYPPQIGATLKRVFGDFPQRFGERHARDLRIAGKAIFV